MSFDIFCELYFVLCFGVLYWLFVVRCAMCVVRCLLSVGCYCLLFVCCALFALYIYIIGRLCFLRVDCCSLLVVCCVSCFVGVCLLLRVGFLDVRCLWFVAVRCNVLLVVFCLLIAVCRVERLGVACCLLVVAQCSLWLFVVRVWFVVSC